MNKAVFHDILNEVLNKGKEEGQRPIRAQWFNVAGQPYKKAVRNYSYIENAVGNSTKRLIMDGYPGDCIEISHAVSGQQIAVVTIKVNGSTTTTWPIFE